jgi:uncharacterized protein (TIGR03118 family)
LEAPWAAVRAPDGFGWASHQLLIGNVDSGQISVFDPKTGGFLGQLADVHGKPIVIDGVWALIFAKGESDDSSLQLFFAAGCAFPPAYSPSLFGRITLPEGDAATTQEVGNLSHALSLPQSRLSSRWK